jgi:hypothetical protein
MRKAERAAEKIPFFFTGNLLQSVMIVSHIQTKSVLKKFERPCDLDLTR